MAFLLLDERLSKNMSAKVSESVSIFSESRMCVISSSRMSSLSRSRNSIEESLFAASLKCLRGMSISFFCFGWFCSAVRARAGGLRPF